ncbi:MAG: TonB-dependent receptor [Ignavibacteria bacterium]|nr:TonB-dependent receptor [Ignavibacteria bacterium]MBT8380728.1 TonB-dependent receptor [Ignavibacteria bacterium]MBT8390469.1 TonB-dependent receptor [Ignavibacteria bacterium]NNJ52909.1 TonB-dependent receptor [Ignavibacteriaceae bacterium]NNL20066.1 TonB-dependent receptor [Ignavibacteriaceae bacterium]
MLRLKTSTCFIILLCLVVLPSRINAQEVLVVGDTTIARIDSLSYETDDVVVTATRVEKKIIDIPYSVVRLKNTQYKFSRKVTIDDVLENVPGLFLQSRYGNHDVRVSIRGFGSRSNTGIRGVRILLDGIPESEPDGQTRIEAIDFNSIGSIEVVKGNSSSLYTNAPGGVINFINDAYFPYSFVTNFNEFGSFDLRRNGLKFGVRTDKYGFLGTYSYHNYKGYRPHSEDYWHIFNTVVDLLPGDETNLQVLGYFVDGLIKLPGSLTKEEFEEDPYQASQREVDRDTKRITTKGRLGLRFKTDFGKQKEHGVEVTGYGTLKYFHRTSSNYRIINRYGIGNSFRYIYRSSIANLDNEFSVGGDMLYQSGPIQFHQNIGGIKGDQLDALTDETISNIGFYFSDYLELYNKQLYLLLTGRYDNVFYEAIDQLLATRSNNRRFEAFTPKAAINFKILPNVSIYSSFGLSFDSPAGNELDNYPSSSDPSVLINPDLKAQKSQNFEIGIKGNLKNPYQQFFSNILFEATFFNSIIEDEIVPFEVFGDVFFRNAAQTTRSGLELGADADILPWMNFQASYTFSDFGYDSYDALTIDENLDTTSQSFTGNEVPSVPKHNIYFALSFNREFTQGITGFIRTSFRHVTGMYVDDANSDKTDSYGILNANAGLDMIFGKFNLLISGGVNNIFDKVFVGFVSINSSTGRFYEAGEPFNYYAGINLGYAIQ